MDNFNIEKEVWKDIFGFEGFYQVSDKGRVRSLDRKVWKKNHNAFNSIKGRMLKPYESTGYWKVMLKSGDRRRRVNVHRLVAEEFLPNPEKLEYVNHKDENKKNNNLENLEWCTQKYNVYYGKNSKIRPIVATNIFTGEQTRYPSMMEAGRICGFDHRRISETCRNKRESYKDHYWHYLEEV